jgi:hypothetical protein
MREHSFADIVEDIRKERTAQDRAHGGPAHDDVLSQWQWVALLTRHIGLAVCDGAPLANSGRFKRQMVCVAALAIAAIQSMERQEAQRDPLEDLRRLGQEYADRDGCVYYLCQPLPKPVSGFTGGIPYLLREPFASPEERDKAIATFTPIIRSQEITP